MSGIRGVLILLAWTALSLVALMPFPEAILISHGTTQRMLGISVLAPYIAAVTVSLLQMVCELFLVSSVGKRLERTARSLWIRFGLDAWWQRVRPPSWGDAKSLARVSGYIGCFVCSVNPLPGTPFSRLTAITIWRTSKLPGAKWVIVAATFIRIALLYGMVLGVRSTFLGP